MMSRLPKALCPLCGKFVGVAVNNTMYRHNAGTSTLKCVASNRNPTYFPYSNVFDIGHLASDDEERK